MQGITHIYTNIHIRHSLLILFCMASGLAQAQVQWAVQSPVPNSTVANIDIFISASINKQYHFGDARQVQIFVDNMPAAGNLKLVNNELFFLIAAPLSRGKHIIRIETYINELKTNAGYEWEFTAGGTGDIEAGAFQQKVNIIGLRGMVQIDNCSEFLSGPGQALRQEPAQTRTLSADAVLTYKNSEISLKAFATSNTVQARQTMNFYQMGYKNKWLTAELGDLNPNFDRLVLTGVRVRGIKLMFTYRAHSLQLCYGEMNRATEGMLLPYEPGNGILPTNLITDSQYVNPGIYKRSMVAGRLEAGNRRGGYKVGVTVFKAWDDLSSIKYGLAPKENIAAGLDFGLNLFRKQLRLQSGVALSVITNDISYGVISKGSLDTTYDIQIDFDPADYKKIITLNASTIPTALDNTDFLAYYTQLSYSNKFQRFAIEYKKTGGTYTSLGNPFLRLNYAGIFASERFYLLQKKMNIGLAYQNYSNNQSGSLPAKIMTYAYRGNVLLNINQQWPSLYLGYTLQLREGVSEIAALPATNDVLNNYMLNLSLNRRFWNINHNFFIMACINNRDNRVENRNGFKAFTGSIGINENISDALNINAALGKIIVSDGSSARISDINTYSAGVDWQIKPRKYTVSTSLSNSNTLATLYTSQSYRISAIGRFRYMFYQSMELLLEGGYQPYRDKTTSQNNYNDIYVYVRYNCDLGQLLTGLR